VPGIVIWSRALHQLPASLAAVCNTLQPVIGVVASAVVFGDPLRMWFAIGTTLVLIGIAGSTAAGVAALVTSRGSGPMAQAAPSRARRILRDL
jgi:drug/metabolite transporter (DMT)-like permease